MKKFILSAILIVCAAFGMSAADLTINAGVGTSTRVGEHSTGSSPRFAYRVGLGVDLPIQGRFGFRTGLNFEKIGTNIDTDGLIDGLDLYSDQMYLEVPLMGTMRFGLSNVNLVFNAGPYLGVGVGGKTKVAYRGESESAKTFGDDGLHRFDMGMGLGAGVEINRFSVGIDTRYGFLHLAEGAKAYNIAMFFNVGYRF